jgi:c-di-GMP-binding flagellar brake protein YcgR
MSEQTMPHGDQQVTMVSVREGDIHVSSAKVLVSGERSVAVEVDTTTTDPPLFELDQAVTLLYSADDRVMRLKTSISELVSRARVTLRPLENAKEGDRRDYRRVDVEAQVFCEPLVGQDVGEARAAQSARHLEPSDYTEQSINLSGSGVMLNSDTALDANTLLDLRLGLPMLQGAPIQIIGRVVRAFDEVAGIRLAVRFAEISEADQDKVVYTVFSCCFE